MSRGLKFCPETNDLLYPRENKQTRRLEYYCKNCPYVEVAQAQDQCVYVSETKHDAKEQTVVLQDVTADPTLPRTQEVTCPSCSHNEAVFFSASSEQVSSGVAAPWGKACAETDVGDIAFLPPRLGKYARIGKYAAGRLHEYSDVRA
jgi:DNA-directed RNA polymerase II subunit RPB9